MAATSKSVDIKISATDDGASATFDKVQSRIGSFAQRAKEANLEARQSGELAVEKLLKGGGAAAGITLAAEGISKAASVIKEFQTAARKGEQDYGAFIDKLAGSVPIFGR